MPSAAEITTLSIDIGTTTVVAARTTNDGTAEVVTQMPATIAVQGDDVMTGDAAAALAITHPDQAAVQLIRRLGDSSPVILDGRAFNISELLGRVVAAVASQAAVEPASTRLVLTHPAAWKDHRLALLSSIGSAHGFAAVELTSDAIAAAADGPDGHALVVDAGGGTVDVTVVAVSTGTAVVATQSLERLGGNDFDQAIFTHVMASVDNMIADLDRRDPAVRHALMKLRTDCTAAKERLSTDTDATIHVVLPGLDTGVRITRAEFESAIRPQVEAIITLVDRVIAAAGVGIDRIVTIGGSASIPVLGELLSGHLGQAVAAGASPATSVARGAATLARRATVPTETATATTDTPTTASDSTRNTSHESGTPMNDAPSSNDPAASTGGSPSGTPGSDGGAASSTPTKRPPIAPPPAAAKKETSAGAKVAVGAAAAAAAAGAAVVFGDDIAAAFDGEDAAATDTGTPTDVSADESMDEFDTVAPADQDAGPVGVPLDTAADAGGFGAGGVDGGSGPAAFSAPAPARPAQRPDRPQADRDGGGNDGGGGGGARQAPTQPRPQREAAEPAQARATDAPAASAAATNPAAAPAQAAAPAPPPAAPSDPAVAGLADAGDARFEAARATLLERLENFEAPPGTSPEDAAVLQQELADAVARFQPQPGQSTEAALAAMRDDYDQRVQDFIQDQKIDALVDELERDNQAEAAAAAAGEPAPGTLLEDDFDGAAERFETSSTPATEPTGDPATGDTAATAETEPTMAEPPVEEPSDDTSTLTDTVVGPPDGRIATAFDIGDIGDVALRSPDLISVRPDLDDVRVTSSSDPSGGDDAVISPVVGGRAGLVADLGGAIPAAAAAAAATGSTESAMSAADSGEGLRADPDREIFGKPVDDRDVEAADGPADDVETVSATVGSVHVTPPLPIDGPPPVLEGATVITETAAASDDFELTLDTEWRGDSGVPPVLGATPPPPEGAIAPAAQLDVDLIGDSVYASVVQSTAAIDVPPPEAILIGLDQPSPAGILIGLDQPGASSVDPAGLQVRAELPADFVPPVMAEPEAFLADIPIVEEQVSDFGLQGLEEEGNLPVAHDATDDLTEG